MSAIGASDCGWADAKLDAGGKVRVSISLTQSGDTCGGIWRLGSAALPAPHNVSD